MSKEDFNELRVLIKHCCAIATSADDGTMQALRKVDQVRDSVAKFRQEIRSELRSLKLLLTQLVRSHSNNDNG